MTEWTRTGRVAWIFEDNFVPDRIMGAENILVFDPERLKTIAMKDFDSEFAASIRPGDFFVAGKNFGYGRAHAPVNIILETFQIGGIIADTFTHNYHEGAINNAFPLVLECSNISKSVNKWDTLEVNFQTGEIKNLTNGAVLQGEGYASDEIDIIEHGGLEAMLTLRLKEKR